MWSKYYETVKRDVNKDYIDLVRHNKEPNQQYIRYWHGSMMIVRPLLIIFSLEQIYVANYIVLLIIAVTLVIQLWKRSKKLAIAYLVSMIAIAYPIVSMCLEYSWIFYIMLISSIIATIMEQNNEKNLDKLFLITGMVTCFFDFLTNEIITLFIPLIIVLALKKEKRKINSFKEGILIAIKVSVLWMIGYVGMWVAKWTLASFILHIDALNYVKDQAMLRVNGLQGLKSAKEMYLGAITKNWHTLYPINIVKRVSTLWTIFFAFIIFSILVIDWKKIKEQKYSSLVLLIIAIIPYIRYLVLANHSFRHYFFTFRSQIVTVMAITYLIFENCRCNDKIKKLANKEIKIKGNK